MSPHLLPPGSCPLTDVLWTQPLLQSLLYCRCLLRRKQCLQRTNPTHKNLQFFLLTCPKDEAFSLGGSLAIYFLLPPPQVLNRPRPRSPARLRARYNPLYLYERNFMVAKSSIYTKSVFHPWFQYFFGKHGGIYKRVKLTFSS